jgi:hypothetical protein
MSPIKVSAEFAAFTWFANTGVRKATAEQAREFAQKNWASFLPCAHEGLGRLLLRLAGTAASEADARKVRRARAPRRRLVTATAG